MLTFIASQLSQNQDFQEITEFFKISDKNRDGRISQDELKAIYEHQGMSLMLGNPEQIRRELILINLDTLITRNLFVKNEN